MQAEANHWLSILFKNSGIIFFFLLLIIFPAIWVCQFTASLHVYNTAFLQQLSLSHNAIVHLGYRVAGHSALENSLHLKKKINKKTQQTLTSIWMLVVDIEKAGKVLWTLSDMSIVPALWLPIHQQGLTFSVIEFRVHKPETGSSVSLAVLDHTAWEPDLLPASKSCFWMGKGWVKIEKVHAHTKAVCKFWRFHRSG